MRWTMFESAIGCICLFGAETNRCDQCMRSRRRVWEGVGIGEVEVDSTHELSATSVQISPIQFSAQFAVYQKFEYHAAPSVCQRFTQAREIKGKQHAVIDLMLHPYLKSMWMGVELHCAFSPQSCVRCELSVTHDTCDWKICVML